MDFLKESIIRNKNEKGTIKIGIKGLTSSAQANIFEVLDSGQQSAVKVGLFVLNNIITELEIEGKEYDPVYVAKESNLAHEQTLKTIQEIGRIAVRCTVLLEESKKKSLKPQSPKERGKVVENAPKA